MDIINAVILNNTIKIQKFNTIKNNFNSNCFIHQNKNLIFEQGDILNTFFPIFKVYPEK